MNANDEVEVFADLYRRHLRVVLAFCLRRTANLEQAEDLAATAFLEAWRNRDRLDLGPESARPLLLGIANNLLRHHWRARRRHAEALTRLRGATVAGEGAAGDDEIIGRLDAQEALSRAQRQMESLPRREREVLSLIAWGDLSYEEAAAALRIPVGTVRSRLARARKRLQDADLGGRPPASLPTEVTTSPAKGADR